jgi:hypothetical protein
MNKESILLKAYNGHYCTATSETWQGVKSIKEGGVVTMIIDTFNWRLNWSIAAKVSADSFEASTYIPEQLQAVDLYVCVSLQDENDEIDISLG